MSLRDKNLQQNRFLTSTSTERQQSESEFDSIAAELVNHLPTPVFIAACLKKEKVLRCILSIQQTTYPALLAFVIKFFSNPACIKVAISFVKPNLFMGNIDGKEFDNDAKLYVQNVYAYLLRAKNVTDQQKESAFTEILISLYTLKTVFPNMNLPAVFALEHYENASYILQLCLKNKTKLEDTSLLDLLDHVLLTVQRIGQQRYGNEFQTEAAHYIHNLAKNHKQQQIVLSENSQPTPESGHVIVLTNAKACLNALKKYITFEQEQGSLSELVAPQYKEASDLLLKDINNMLLPNTSSQSEDNLVPPLTQQGMLTADNFSGINQEREELSSSWHAVTDFSFTQASDMCFFAACGVVVLGVASAIAASIEDAESFDPSSLSP